MFNYERGADSERNTKGERSRFEASQEARGDKKGVVAMKLKLDSCKKSKMSELLTLMTSAQTSKENIMQCLACDKIYVDPPSADWIDC
ncbi:hypothetical protein AVEN_244292-1 [Araneus ventricosus]|uniref:Uncharacterized protein n=1 Tax=Araneus ventricosus TaxID=182803 RepID=A0A4Y2F4R7_ARAVE|nr:hypothetical protein AVEN_244292-1 [Araneus ventricosus]